MAVGVYSLAYEFSEGFSSRKARGFGPVPGKQYIILVGLVKGKSFFQFEVSNLSSDVQK
jgi:hypothetical protein